jgi:hypothetical protein
MPLTPAKCTQCGASLQVDPSKDAAICEFCGTPFIVEKAIAQYATGNTPTAQALLDKAMQFLSLGEQQNFERFARQALDVDPLYIPARWALVEHASWYESLVNWTYNYFDGPPELSERRTMEKIGKRFAGLMQLCKLDPQNKEHYIQTMACKEVPALIQYYERERNEKYFARMQRKGSLTPDYAIGPPFAAGLRAVTEENLPGIADIFKREMAVELERLHPQLFGLVKEMFD